MLVETSASASLQWFQAPYASDLKKEKEKSDKSILKRLSAVLVDKHFQFIFRITMWNLIE